MDLETIEVDRKEVEEELKSIKQAIKDGYISRRTALGRDLMAVYRHLEHGGKVVDIFKVFHDVGLDKEGHPRLAIVPFDARTCYLYQLTNGGAIFSKENKDRNAVYATKGMGDVALPPDTYAFTKDNRGRVEQRFKTIAPMVPPRILTIASAKLTPQYYHVVFEPELWVKSKEPAPPAPRDPILGRMLTPNIFGVIATWDLTELERSILKGRAK